MSHRSAHINRKVTIGQKKRFAKLKKKRAKSNNHHVNKYGKNGGNQYRSFEPWKEMYGLV